MRKFSFCIEPEQIEAGLVSIIGEEFRHLRSVLRLGQGDVIHLIDGQGGSYEAMIDSMSKNSALIRIITHEQLVLPEFRLSVFQGIGRGKTMDLIVQKLTELGVLEVVPVMTQFALNNSRDRKKWPERIERWQKIARSACKQSKRVFFPVVMEPLSFNDAVLALAEYDESFILWENETTVSLQTVLKNEPKGLRVAILIGPEGGLAPEEIEFAARYSIPSVSLGNAILRTETAAIATAAIIQFCWGNS